MSENGLVITPITETLAVAVKQNFGKKEVLFSISRTVTVSSMAEQHIEFEKILAQLEWEIGNYATEHLAKQDQDISKSYKTPGGTLESQKAIRAEWGTWKGKPVIKLFTPRYIKYGLTVFDDQMDDLNTTEWMNAEGVTDLKGWTAQVDVSGKFPRLVALTKDS